MYVAEQTVLMRSFGMKKHGYIYSRVTGDLASSCTTPNRTHNPSVPAHALEDSVFTASNLSPSDEQKHRRHPKKKPRDRKEGICGDLCVRSYLNNVRHSRSGNLFAGVQPSATRLIHQPTAAGRVPALSTELRLVHPHLLPRADGGGLQRAVRRSRSALAAPGGGRESGRAGAARAASPWSSLELGHGQILDGGRQALNAQQSGGVGEFEVGDFVDEGAQSGSRLFGGVGGQDLGRRGVGRVAHGWRRRDGRDLGVHGETVQKLIDGRHWLIPESVVFSTVKHSPLYAGLRTKGHIRRPADRPLL